tara:strand:- start:162 stop:374 length:213 start_codon:yes stop_codon:yes gene_type:complete
MSDLVITAIVAAGEDALDAMTDGQYDRLDVVATVCLAVAPLNRAAALEEAVAKYDKGAWCKWHINQRTHT